MTQPVVVTNVLHSLPLVVFSAKTMDGKTTRFVDNQRVLGRAPCVGETWEVTGTSRVHPVYGRQVSITVAAPSRPTGRLFLQTVSGHRNFPGIGMSRALRLWDGFGEVIVELLDQGDSAPFVPILGADLAGVMLSGWQALGVEATTYRWLTSLDLPPKLAAKIIAIYGDLAVPADAADDAKVVGPAIWHMQQDPYRMLAIR